MRKIISSIMLVAVAAMASVSCQKQEIAAPETVSATLTLNASVEQTKTYLGEDNEVLWGIGEALTLYVGSGETAKFFSASTDAYDGQASASFTFEIKDVTEADSYALGGVYPASASNGITNDNPESFKIALPATQNAEPEKYDPSAYIMVLKPEKVEELPTEYTASFRRAVALNKITLTNVKEAITSVEITVPENKYLAGRRYINLTTGESGDIYENGGRTNTIKVNSTYSAGTVDVWFTSWGVELNAADESTSTPADQLIVKMISSSKVYTRTIDVKEQGIKFEEGHLNTLTINMATATEETNTDLSGDYLIAAMPGGWMLMSGTNDGSYYDRVESKVTTEVDKVLCSDFYGVASVENCVWRVAKIEGGYSIQNNATGKYMCLNSNGNNAHESETACPFDIAISDKVAKVVPNNFTARELEYNSGSPRFAFYQNTQNDVYFIPWVEDTNPKINVTEPTTTTIEAEGGDLTFTCTTKNLDGETLKVVEESEFLTWSVAENVVTITVAANEAEESRTLNAVIKCGSVEVPVTINQGGKPAEGTPTSIVDVLDRDLTGATSTSYIDWSGKKVASNAVYAGNSAGGNSSIQLRSDKSTSGIVATTSGGNVRKIKVTWNSNTAENRTLDIYGKNTAYSAASELYSSTTQGTKLGSIKNGTSELEITGDYEYIGLRSSSGAMYLTSIEITWETNGGSGSGETPDPTPEPELQERNLQFSETTTTATVGEEFAEPTLTGAAAGVTYSSSNTSVATVNETTGKVTIVAAGETIITATAVADATYKAGTATYTLTVKPAQEDGDEGDSGDIPTTKTWKLVTDASTLKAGDKLAIVSTSKGKIASATIDSGYIKDLSVSISNNSFKTLPSDAAELTLGGSSTSWTLANASGKLLGATAAKKVAWGSGTTTWTISIAENGDATIQNSTSSYGRFLYNVNSPRFTTYTSNTNTSMLLPQIYRYE